MEHYTEVDNEQYIFTESNIQEGTKELPLDQLLELADKIWSDVKHNPGFNKEEKLSELTDYYFNKYKDFSYSFPIVIRWMIQLGKYNKKAFKKYLFKYKETKITCRKDFAILQAEYLVFLYKEENHYDQKYINNYREFIVKQLVEEEELHKKVEEEFNDELKKIDREKRERLFQYLLNIKSAKSSS